MTIFVGHGVVSGADAKLFNHRNLLDREAFLHHLRTRSDPYVSLDRAISGTGDAITFDDSTNASADAALLSRQLGHDVTLFVNASNIVTGGVYWFGQVNALLDATFANAVRFRGVPYDLGDHAGKCVFRSAIKRIAVALPTEEARITLVDEVAHALCVHSYDVPEYSRTITVESLRQLVDAGVRIENHGWTHSQYWDVATDRLLLNITQGREWLIATIHCDAVHYAVPYGESLPPDDLPRSEYRTWFLADSRYFDGAIGRQLVNRSALRVARQRTS